MVTRFRRGSKLQLYRSVDKRQTQQVQSGARYCIGAENGVSLWPPDTGPEMGRTSKWAIPQVTPSHGSHVNNHRIKCEPQCEPHI